MSELRPRRPWLAFFLSFAWPGLGQLYVGRAGRACAAFALTCVFIIPAAMVIPMILSSSIPLGIAGYLLALGLIIVVPIDAALFARRYSLHVGTPWNRMLIYIAFGLGATLLIQLERSWLPRVLWLTEARVPTGGMIPAILVGDQVIVDRRSSTLSSVRLGDIVVFESPADPGAEYVKRLAGLPGNTIEVRNGVLSVDGVRTASEGDRPGHLGLITENLGRHVYQARVSASPAAGPCEDWGPARVPENSLFLLGDNRCNSRDSRTWGFVPMRHLRGSVLNIHWSQDPESKQVRWERLGMNLVDR